MKKKQRMFLVGERPVVVTKDNDYVEVSLYGYNGYNEVSIFREWGEAGNKLPAKEGEIAAVKKYIAALEEIVEHAEKW